MFVVIGAVDEIAELGGAVTGTAVVVVVGETVVVVVGGSVVVVGGSVVVGASVVDGASVVVGSDGAELAFTVGNGVATSAISTAPHHRFLARCPRYVADLALSPLIR